MDYDVFNSQQWRQLLSLLSLDEVVPLYEIMGLTVRDKAKFLQVLRQTIREIRVQYEADAMRVPTVAAMLIGNLEREMSAETALTFIAWAKTVFLGNHSDQPTWSAWDIVFSHWAYSRQRDIAFLPEDLRDYLVTGYREQVDAEDIEKQIETQKMQRLSEWDMEVFARQGYSIEDAPNPYLTVKFITRIHRLQTFSAQFARKLSSSEKEQVNRQAQSLIDELGVWMPGPVPGIDTLWS